MESNDRTLIELPDDYAEAKTVIDPMQVENKALEYSAYPVYPAFDYVNEEKRSNNEDENANYLWPDMTLRNDRYRIIEYIGAGGFSFVYRALDTKSGIEVAIKEMFIFTHVNRVPGDKRVIIVNRKQEKDYGYYFERFRLEAKTMARFDRVKGIVDVYDFFTENNTAYIVMELLSGDTLKEYVEKNGNRIDIETANKITCQILDALSVIHEKAIIHRDIKHDNIKIDSSGAIKIIDFGAARFTKTEAREVSDLTKVFTPGFAPPEQLCDGSTQGPYTDVYAVAAVYYYLVTGKQPQESREREENDKLIPIEEAADNVPEHVARAIGRSLELNPGYRLSTVGELKKALLGEIIVRTTKEEKARRIKRRIAIIASVVSLLIFAFLGVYIYKMSHAEDITIDKIVLSDTDITIAVPLDNNDLISQNQMKVWLSVSEEFSDYIEENSYREIGVSCKFVDEFSYEKNVLNTDPPNLFFAEGFENSPSMNIAYSLISEENTILFNYYQEKTMPDNEYVIALDPVVLFVNMKLLEGINGNSSADYFDSVDKILSLEANTGIELLVVNEADRDFYENETAYEREEDYFTALESFCMGTAVFYIGHSSDNIEVSESLPGMYKIVEAPDAEGIRVWKYSLQLNENCTKDELNSAQLFLNFITGDETQDRMFVQSGHLMPVNPRSFEKYMEFNPEMSFISDRINDFYFVG